MIWLQFLFPLLFSACLLAGRATLKQWGYASILAEAVFLLPLTIFFTYLYTGVIVKDPFAPQARLFFIQNILYSGLVLGILCSGLTLLILALIGLGVRSQTLTFVPDVEADVAVEHIRGDHYTALGYASRSRPLTRRFRAGQHQFRFIAQDFDLQEQAVLVNPNFWSGQERRIPVALCAAPIFVLRDFQWFASEFFGFPEKFHVPSHLKNHDSIHVSLTLAASSATPMWIQNVALRVLDVKALRMATFPLEGLGGDGAEPILGWVELKPRPGTYSIVAERKAQLGRGIAPDDYRLQVFSTVGYKYSAQIEITWADMQDQRRTGNHVFEDKLSLEFPRIVKWEELIQGARELKILYSEDLHIVLPWILFEQTPPRYEALVSSRGYKLDEEQTLALPGVTLLPEKDAESLYELLGNNPKIEAPPSFILIDSRILLLLSPQHIHLAEIIEDTERIAAVERAFDTLTKRL